MYDDEFELTFDMAEDNAETVKLPGKPLQPAPEAPEAPEPAGKAKEPEVPDFPDDEPTIVIPARKPREMPKQEREPVRAEPVPELAPAEVKAPEEPAAAPEAPVPAIRTNGRTVLISGGDRGIGAATAKAFYEAGYRGSTTKMRRPLRRWKKPCRAAPSFSAMWPAGPAVSWRSMRWSRRWAGWMCW